MKIPLDMKALLSAAFDIEKAKKTPVSVNVMIDETVSPDFQAFLRSGFVGQSASSRVMMSYFPTQDPDVGIKADITVIVAGLSEEIGELAALFRSRGNAVLVIAENIDLVQANAQKAGFPIPEKDLMGLHESASNEEAQKVLADHIGMWIVETNRDKSLAFSLAFPFVRRPLAQNIVLRTSIQNAGVGALVFVPGADMPVMTLNQAKMVLQIAAAYGFSLEVDRVKELAGVFAGAVVFRGISRQAVALIPALGWVIKGAMGYTGTMAIGKAALEYFEQGGNMAGLAGIVNSTREALLKACARISNSSDFNNVKEVILPQVKKVTGAAKTKVVPVASETIKKAISAVKR